jgi:hypothetical protein
MFMVTVCGHIDIILKDTFNVIWMDQLAPEVGIMEANLCVDAEA